MLDGAAGHVLTRSLAPCDLDGADHAMDVVLRVNHVLVGIRTHSLTDWHGSFLAQLGRTALHVSKSKIHDLYG